MIELPNEQQLFYIKDEFSPPQPSLDGTRWPEEMCQDYLYKHLTWFEMQDVINPPKTDEDLFAEKSLSEHRWVLSEFDKVQVNLMYHWTGDVERSVATEQEWKDYAIALRNYTTTDEKGNPVLVGEERPIAPV